ncbi:MAG: winged helix DNA-binding protein [Candidatus Thermoplasmatota archaeon]|nr:winged helix DNA-binding protein [Candidatus Thermoplasmatota archaeon]
MEDRILQNDIRRSIYKHIMKYPGVQFTVLKDIFGIPEGTLRYHIRYLERKKKVRSDMHEGRRCYYTVDPDRTPLNATMKLSPVQERILNTVRKRRGITQKSLCEETSTNRFTLMYNLKKLVSYGLLRRYSKGREVHYQYISRRELDRQVLRRATIDLLNGRIDEDTFGRIADRFDED